MTDDDFHDIDIRNATLTIENTLETDDSERTHAFSDMDIQISGTFEADPRTLEELFGPDDIELESTFPHIDGGTYRQCLYCEDTWVERDHYDDHLETVHGLDR